MVACRKRHGKAARQLAASAFNPGNPRRSAWRRGVPDTAHRLITIAGLAGSNLLPGEAFLDVDLVKIYFCSLVKRDAELGGRAGERGRLDRHDPAFGLRIRNVETGQQGGTGAEGTFLAVRIMLLPSLHNLRKFARKGNQPKASLVPGAIQQARKIHFLRSGFAPPLLAAAPIPYKVES